MRVAAPRSTPTTLHPCEAADAVNPDTLRRTFGDDPTAFKEILMEFVPPARANLAEIQAARARRSTAGVKAAAHKLKSSARAVGAHALADLCVGLEAAGERGDWLVIDREAPRLEGCLEMVHRYTETL